MHDIMRSFNYLVDFDAWEDALRLQQLSEHNTISSLLVEGLVE